MRRCFPLFFLLLLVARVFGQSNPLPYINDPLVPPGAQPAGKAFILTVNGTNFAPSAFLTWNGAPRPTAVFSSSQLKAKIAAADIQSAGTATVRVVNPAPGGGSSSPVYFPVRAPSPTVALEISNPVVDKNSSLAAGDFNNDGNIDLAVSKAGSQGTLRVFLGNGDGTFGKPITTSLLTIPSFLWPADFNGDGKLDLAISYEFQDQQSTYIYLGNGDGTFTFQPTAVQGNVLAMGDFNSDGKLDLLTSTSGGGCIYLGNGDGTFVQGQCRDGMGSRFSVAVGDFNRDGRLDLFNGNVFLNNGDGSFTLGASYPAFGSSFTAADIDGDGILDVIDDRGEVFLGNGDGTFGQGTPISLFGFSQSVQIADFNGDGKLDVAAGFNSFASSGATIALGNGDGTFQSPLKFASGSLGNSVTVGFPMADFNNDGELDVGVAGTATLLLQTTVDAYPNLLGFGGQTVGSGSKPKTSVLSNIGASTMNIESIAVTGTNSGDFSQKNNCPPALTAGASCKIQADFTPTAKGARRAAISVVTLNPTGTQTIVLTGTGR